MCEELALGRRTTRYMSRPLLNADIAKLERIFLAGERKTIELRRLEHELRFRTTARADLLARKVGAALQRCVNGESFPDKTLPPSVPNEVVPLEEAAMARMPPADQLQPRFPDESAQTRPTVDTVQNKPKEVVAAYAALKLGPGAAWEEIETRRRAIVARASPAAIALSPAEEADTLRSDALNANRAAALLCAFAERK